jgi:hypothetical protein
MSRGSSFWLVASMFAAALGFFLPVGLADSGSGSPPSSGKSVGDIVVHVLDPSGKPVNGASVLLVKRLGSGHHRAAGSGPARHQMPPIYAQGQTDGNGSFTFTNIPEGPWGVLARVRHVGHGHAMVNLSGNSAEVTITLQPPQQHAPGGPATRP